MRFLLLLLLGCSFHTARAQDNCTALFNWLQSGKALTYTDYNRKGKETGRSTMRVTQLKPVAEGTKANIELDFEDEAMEDYDMSYAITCAGDRLIIDMSSMLNPALMQSFASMETEVDYDGIELPAQLTVGQPLDDGTMTVRTSMSGAPGLGMTMTITTKDRQVVDRETLTTPAGTFDTYKITYEQQVKLLGARSYQVAEWWSTEAGLVKSEMYTRNGKLQSSHVLTARQ